MTAALLMLLCTASELDFTEHVATEERPVGVSAGMNFGLISLEVGANGIYGFGAVSIGTAMLTNGSAAIGAFGLGYSFALGPPAETMWVFDVFAIIDGGALPVSGFTNSPVVGALGAGLGFRWLHHSGFTLGFKLPIVGAVVASKPSLDAGTSALAFYWANVISLPLMSLGYRF